MTLQEKEDTLFREKNSKKPLLKLKVDYKDPPPVLHFPDRQGQFQLYSDTSKFATGGGLYQFKMANPSSLHMQAKECQKQPKLFYHRSRNVWPGNKHCNLCPSFKES